MMPEAGGEYVYLREAYGRRWAFLFGWTQCLIARTASQAALAVGFAIFLNILTGGALDAVYFTLHPFGHAIPFGHLQVVALATLAVTTLINCGAITLSGRVASWLTVVKIGLVATVGLGALVFARGDWAHFALANAGGDVRGCQPIGARRTCRFRRGDAGSALGVRRLEQRRAARRGSARSPTEPAARVSGRHGHRRRPVCVCERGLLLRADAHGNRQRLAVIVGRD